MLNKLSICAAVFMLSGCMWQTVSQDEITKATEICGGKGGVNQISSSFEGSVFVRCLNGEKYNIWSFR